MHEGAGSISVDLPIYLDNLAFWGHNSCILNFAEGTGVFEPV
jgi:hypothetical protein